MVIFTGDDMHNYDLRKKAIPVVVDKMYLHILTTPGT